MELVTTPDVHMIKLLSSYSFQTECHYVNMAVVSHLSNE
jgi:hypothetical protein